MLSIFVTFIIMSEAPGTENMLEGGRKAILTLCIHHHACSVHLCKHYYRN